MNSDFKQGAKDSLPIVVGYLGVSFTFGIMASSLGMHPMMAGLMSLTNLTSAGQFAGLSLIYAQAGVLEIILTQIVINLRYAIMSLAITQKLAPNTGRLKRMLMAFGVTDEVFAISISRREIITGKYMLGLEIFPLIAWTFGTIAGAVANNLLPLSVQSALGIALYGMFIGIVMPTARKEIKTMIVVLIALGLSCLMAYAPVLKEISPGFAIIICTILAAGAGAFLFPRKEDEEEEVKQ